jgi:hypothetical protein
MSFFQSGRSVDVFLSWSASYLMAGLAVGSSLILFRSLGKLSLAYFYYCSLMSFLSFASYPLFIAALWREPSGFMEILIGERHNPALVVCPCKKGGSSSFSSISGWFSSFISSSSSSITSVFCMFSSSIMFSTFPPFSRVSSHKSGEASRFFFF